MKKKIGIYILLVVLTTTTTGCMKIINKGEEGKYTGKTTFDASNSVEGIWDEVVSDIEGRAIEITELLVEANGDLSAVADKYGKYSMGDQGTINYPVKGTAVVEQVEKEKKAGYITLKLAGYSGTEEIKMQIGSVYKGSSTRDTLSVIHFGDYTNQEEWAAMSQQLHRFIDEKVIKPIDFDNLVGKKIAFTGTFTAEQKDEVLITPIRLEVQ